MTKNEYLKAFDFAATAHAGQVDKGGAPYIGHPVRVSLRVAETDPGLAPAALLHDVVEDCGVTLDDLRAAGFSERTVAAVDAMTRRDGETYFSYMHRVVKDADGRVVKRADLEDNMDPTRASTPPPSMMKRYEKSLAMVAQAEADEEAGLL